MSTLENQPPESHESDLPAQPAGIFLEEQPVSSEHHDFLGLVAVGEAIPPLSDIDNPIEAVRKLGQHSRKYGELIVRASAGGHTFAYVTEETYESHIDEELKKVDAKLEKYYGSGLADGADS